MGWMRWDERTMGVVKRYVEVNPDLENETMIYIEVWTERQRNVRNRINVLS